MKRMHIHVGVDSLSQSIRFYTALFGADPVKTRDDYAKWMLDDPRINFAISTRADHKGVDHLGVQVDEDGELEDLRERVKQAGLSLFSEGETVCCYARSEKSWLEDPSGVAWEAFKTMEDVQVFSGNRIPEAAATGDDACCAPKSAGSACC